VLFEYEFMRNALVAALLVSVATGIIGVLVVVNRMVFVSGGIAHAAYGGVGLGTFLGISPVVGAFVFTFCAAIGIGTVQRRAGERADTIIGVMWAVGMAIGVIFTELTPGFKGDLMSYLFGSILMVPAADLWWMLALDAAILLVVLVCYRQLVALSFDETFATIRNLPVGALYLVLVALIAFAIVMMMRVTGLILVIALLTIPVAIAGWFVQDLKRLMVVAAVLGAAFNVCGIMLSFWLDLSSGATIIALAGTIYLGGLLLRSLYRSGFRSHGRSFESKLDR
jgi:zinc transport system permease protein